MAPRGTLWGSFCDVATLSVIETILTKFGQNLGFSLRNSVSLSPGPAVKELYGAQRNPKKPLCFKQKIEALHWKRCSLIELP